MYDLEQAVALEAAIAAAQLCEQIRQSRQATAMLKPDASPVTIADYGSQALLCRAIRQAFPLDPIVAEEDADWLTQANGTDYLEGVIEGVSQSLGEAVMRSQLLDWVGYGQGQRTINDWGQQRFWTLDPIDGTKGYVRGDQYGIAIALIEHGQVQLGVIACPALPVTLTPSQGGPSQAAHTQNEIGVVFVAQRGQSARMVTLSTRTSIPLHVRGEADRANFRLIESVEASHGTPTKQRAVARAVGLTQPPLAMDSLAKYGAIARGDADLYLRLPSQSSNPHLRQENIWDHAAGVVILEAAGGQVSDRHGQPLDFSYGPKLSQNEGIVASNGILHSAVLQALQHSRPPCEPHAPIQTPQSKTTVPQ